ncbi:MAG: hypothetical protein Q4A49_00780 [Neisseria sp.]|nr:hypothetical protein [Neisseria sp.]
MKIRLSVLAVCSLILAACQSNAPRLGKEGRKLNEIRHICIIEPSDAENNLNPYFAKALQQHGISSESVNVKTDRKRLYQDECRYNLRYTPSFNSRDRQKLTYLNVLIRTPDHPVASFRSRSPDGKDLQTQVSRTVSSLLGKNTQ